MKITTYNPDGSIREVRQHHFQIPEYITSFDANHSFLNITEDDLAALDFDDDSDMFKDKFLFLLNHDISNYINSLTKPTPRHSLISNLCGTNVDVNELTECNKLLHRFIDALDSGCIMDSEIVRLREDTKRIMNIETIVDILLFNLRESIDNGRLTRITKEKFLNIIHRLYGALHTGLCLRIIFPIEIMHILQPFAKSELTDIKITDNQFLDKFIHVLTSVDSKYRKELYRLLLAFGYRPTEKTYYNQSVRHLSFGSVDKGSNLYTVVDAQPNSEIENIKAELDKEEIVALYIDCPVSNEYKQEIKDILNKQYEKFSELNGDYLRTKIERKAMRVYGYTELIRMIKQDWYEFYFKYLNELENYYKHIHVFPINLEVPLYYYYLLVEECECGAKYTIDGKLLDSLLLRSLKKGCENKMALYEQMYILNFVEIKAKLIPDEKAPSVNLSKEDEYWDKIAQLRNELLEGNCKEIAKKLKDGEFDIQNGNDAINFFMVWLEPLFKWHINNDVIDEIKFKEIFKRILKSKLIFDNLLVKRNRIAVKHHLNIKLVLNIVGYLAENGKEKYVQRRVGASLEKELLYLWKNEKKDGTSSYYHKYVSGWDSSDYSSDLSSQMKDDMKEFLII